MEHTNDSKQILSQAQFVDCLDEEMGPNMRDAIASHAAALALIERLRSPWIPVGDLPEGHPTVMLGLYWFDQWREEPPAFVRVHNWMPRVLRVVYYAVNEFDDVDDGDFQPGWYEESFIGETCHFVEITHVMPMPTNFPAPPQEATA
jgi:hypothetical protein